MATEDTKAPRIVLGPEAAKLAMSDGGKGRSDVLDQCIITLQEQAASAEQRAAHAENEAKRYQLQSEKLTNGFDALRDLSNAVVGRNKISTEVARVFEQHFQAIHKSQLHICGLIGLNAVDEEEREVLVKEMTRNVSDMRSDLGDRTGGFSERSRENVEVTQKVVREVNDTRAAVQSSNNQELDLVLGDDGGMER